MGAAFGPQGHDWRDQVAKGDWQRALAAAGEITEAWLTDEDADLGE